MGPPSYILDALTTSVRILADRIGAPAAALAGDADALVRDPAALAAALAVAVRQLDDDARLRSLAGAGAALPAVAAGTAWRRVQRRREDALVALVRALATATLARRSAVRTWPDRDTALARGDFLAGRIDALESGSGDALYGALRDLRAAWASHLRAILPELARVIDLTPRDTLPSLVIAYDLRERVDVAGQIVTRNRVVRPGFVPPTPLRVASS